MEVNEADWKIFRKKLPKWQEDYMERLVKGYASLLAESKPASYKYWELRKRINQDRKCSGVVIEPRRSTMYQEVVGMILDGVITLDDISDFSDDFKENIKIILGE